MIASSEPSIQGPLPAFFYFALSGENSITLDPFNQPVQFLKPYPIRVFSWTLPGHGEGLKDTDAMKIWYESWASGKDPIEPFIQTSLKNIDQLIKEGKVDPEKMAVGGLSRGGYAACRLASVESRLKHIVGFAPLVSPARLDEFQGKVFQPLEDYIDQLANKSLWFSIGNLDTRVNTDSVYQFVRKLTDRNFEKGNRSPQVNLTIKPSIGYKGHGTAPETFKEGVLWLAQQFNLQERS